MVYDFYKGMADVLKEDKWGIVNKNGVLVLPCVFDMVLIINENLVAGEKNGKWCFYDKNGNQFLRTTYIEKIKDLLYLDKEIKIDETR